MLGYDTLFFGAGPDETLRRLRDESGRFLLTRDSDFCGEARTLVLQSDVYLEQLQGVVRSLQLDPYSHRYSLCIECNQAIRAVGNSTVHVGSVPEWVIREEHPLWQCPGCQKLYWAGSHLERMDERFDGLFAQPEGSS